LGFNPFHQTVKRKSDIVFVAAALIVVVALLAWALLA
jgi:hypothetical protein